MVPVEVSGDGGGGGIDPEKKISTAGRKYAVSLQTHHRDGKTVRGNLMVRWRRSSLAHGR